MRWTQIFEWMDVFHASRKPTNIFHSASIGKRMWAASESEQKIHIKNLSKQTNEKKHNSRNDLISFKSIFNVNANIK